jgi:hypothetical protein
MTYGQAADEKQRAAREGRPVSDDLGRPSGIAVLTRHLLPPSEGARYRQATLTLSASGDLCLTTHEMGASLQAAWGADDDERTVSIPREAVARLAFALLSEQLAGHGDALDQLSAFCEDHCLAHTLASWT